MGRKSNAEKDSEFLSKVRKQFKDAHSYDSENREEAREDLRFLAGEQWDDDALESRKGRPTLTINRMPQFCKQVTGDFEQSQPAIAVKPVDSESDPDLAEVYAGLIRNIERNGGSREAYNVAFRNAVYCGIGNFRILTQYSTDTGFEQEIVYKPIHNPFAVYWDPRSRKSDRSDAAWCFVTERLAKKEFERRYPKASNTDFESGSGEDDFLWSDDDSVRIAEYWYKEHEKRIFALTASGKSIDVTELSAEEIDLLKMEEGEFERTRTVEVPCVYRAVVNGKDILEEPKKWPGKYIPVVAIVGEEIHLGDRVYRSGVIRHAKDAQRMYNYWRSAQTESVALQPKAPYIVDVKGIENYQEYWARANDADLPYLPYDYQAAGGMGPKREMPPVMSQGMTNEIALASDDMKATTGIYDSALGNRSNESSGKAIIARARESDTATFGYHDNAKRAIEQAGRILVDLIPKIYDTERVVRVLGIDEDDDVITINQTMSDGTVVNDLSIGNYDVVVTVGPSYGTKRQESAESMANILQANPALWNVIGDLLAENLDWPGAQKMAERLKKTIPPELKGQEDGEEQQEDPRVAMMQQELQKAGQVMQSLLQEMEQLKQEKALEAADTQSKIDERTAKTQGQALDNAEAQLELAAKSGLLEEVVRQQVLAVLQSMQPQPMM